MPENLPTPGGLPPSGNMLIYQDGATRLQVRLDGQTVWLPQVGIAELFQTTKQNVSLHIQNIFEEGELDPAATVNQYLTVQMEGKRQVRRALDHYNLDVILAIGYRVRSHRGTQFRQWATARLSELLVKGFTLDDERIKAGRTLGGDYFEELLARIRDIRVSERMFYQKITDIYATSIDYDAAAEITKTFFRPMHMADWIAKLDGFLTLSDRDILTHLGKISHVEAEAYANGEFVKFETSAAASRPLSRRAILTKRSRTC